MRCVCTPVTMRAILDHAQKSPSCSRAEALCVRKPISDIFKLLYIFVSSRSDIFLLLKSSDIYFTILLKEGTHAKEMRLITEEQAISLLKKYAPSEEIFQKVLAHVKAVQKVALQIAERCPGVNMELIIIGSLLHDIGRFL